MAAVASDSPTAVHPWDKVWGFSSGGITGECSVPLHCMPATLPGAAPASPPLHTKPPPPLSSPSTTPRLCSLPVPTAWFSSCHFSFSKPHSVASRAPAPPPLCTCAPAALNHAPCTHHIPSSEAALPSAYLPSTPSSRPTHLPSILLKSGALFCQEGPTPSILEKPFLSQENATDRAR